ncbi:hypothetical protein [Streptomyces marianii]|uniref:Uncharacterized protein n=1 Tax=Streptomyces marianii TaxID=1817406 RepID=A0A5R9E4Q3_9ACTN|nr:hypothetical protein [Streptomyces marianii]TLQ44961.1 hypothetical protein FEF34_19490 [Streptomyces marianii]
MLERLIGQQRRPQNMARSTIQEKLRGKSKVNLTQALSIVDALAEYAQSNGTPLPDKEINREVWQDRVAAYTKTQPNTSHRKETTSAPSEIKWDIAPLHAAQMDDLVEMIQENRFNAVADWLPKFLAGIMQAQMATTNFLRQAAEDTPQAIAQTLKALDAEFPYVDTEDPFQSGWDRRRSAANEATVGLLIEFAARKHGADASPAVVVALRRASLGFYAESFLSRVGTWFLAEKIAKAVDHLRSASLYRDAKDVLTATSDRSSDRIFEVVDFLQTNSRTSDADIVLKAIGEKCDENKLLLIVSDFEEHSASTETLTKIARAVSSENREAYISLFTQTGGSHFETLLREAATDDPSF